jgi:hypothetical protein
MDGTKSQDLYKSVDERLEWLALGNEVSYPRLALIGLITGSIGVTIPCPYIPSPPLVYPI